MTSVRLAWYYAAAFAVIGVSMPFWPLWLKSRGLSVEDIGLVVAIGIAAKALANPLIASTADRMGERSCCRRRCSRCSTGRTASG
jgi:PPP family 3-phenylpropionic acid transporter